MFKNNLKNQSPKNMNHKLHIYPVSRKLYTEYTEGEWAALNRHSRKDLWVLFLLWWRKPEPLVLESTSKNLWPMKILKWQFLKPPISQEYFQPSLSCSLWHGDENTRSTHRLGIKPWKRETVGRVSNIGLWLDEPCDIWVHAHPLTHQLYLTVGQGNLTKRSNKHNLCLQADSSLSG